MRSQPVPAWVAVRSRWFVAAALLAASSATASGDPLGWREIPFGPAVSPRILAPAPGTDPRMLLWSGLIHRSTDWGAHWELVPARFEGQRATPALRTLAFDPADAGIAWATAADRVYRSTDLGASWQRWGSAAPGTEIRAFVPGTAAMDAWIGTAGGNGAGVYRTTDGGTTWSPRLVGGSVDVNALAVRPGDPDLIVAGAESAIARSTDGGSSWAVVRPGPEVSQLAWDAVGAVLVAHQRDLVESTDAGLTWHELGRTLGQGPRPFALDPDDPDRLLIADSPWCGGQNFGYGNEGSLVSTTNGGATWQERTLVGCELVGGRSDAAGGVEIRGNRQWSWFPDVGIAPFAIKYSENGGGDWTNRTAGIHEVDVVGLANDRAGSIFLFTRVPYPSGGQGVTRSTDGGFAWSGLDSQGDGSVRETSETRPGLLLDAGFDGSYDVPSFYARVTTDGGETWTPPDGYPPGIGYPWPMFLPWRGALTHGTGEVVYLWSGSIVWTGLAQLARSDDGGASYTHLGNQPFPGCAILTPEDDRHVFMIPNRWVASHPGAVLHTTDGGASWAPRSTGLPGGTPVRLRMDPADGSHLLVFFGSGLPWASTDGGLSWAVADPTRDAPSASPETRPVPPASELRNVVIHDGDWEIAPSGERIFLATSVGVWISDRGFVDEGLPSIAFGSVSYDPVHGVLLAGSSLGAFALDLPPLGAAAREPTTAAPGTAGASLSLHVHPNPFAGGTNVDFSLPSKGAVRVDVFDAAGRRVRTLLDAVLPAGRHDRMWDLRGTDGRRAAPGVYFVNLRTASGSVTRRVVAIP